MKIWIALLLGLLLVAACSPGGSPPPDGGVGGTGAPHINVDQ